MWRKYERGKMGQASNSTKAENRDRPSRDTPSYYIVGVFLYAISKFRMNAPSPLFDVNVKSFTIYIREKIFKNS